MIGSILKILDLFDSTIDKAIVDKDLARQLKHDLKLSAISLDAEELKSATAIITAEAAGESWLQRNWRPLTMLWFVGLIGAYWVGLAPDYLVDNPETVAELFKIVQIGLGGYVMGRSAEKIVKTYKAPELEKAKGESNGS